MTAVYEISAISRRSIIIFPCWLSYSIFSNDSSVCLSVSLFFPGAKSTAGFEGVAYKVAAVFIHPQYIPNSKPPGPFDIALIRLAGKVLNIPPACLPAVGSPITSNLCGIAGE